MDSFRSAIPDHCDISLDGKYFDYNMLAEKNHGISLISESAWMHHICLAKNLHLRAGFTVIGNRWVKNHYTRGHGEDQTCCRSQSEGEL